MKKIYILLFAFAAAVGMTGCTSEMPEKTADEGGDILIRLQMDALETKSAPTGDENYVENLQLLIFKTTNTAPVACLTPTITAGGGPFEQNYANAAALATGLTGKDLKTATVFAVANCSTNLSTITSLANAKAVAVDAAAMVSNTSEGYKVNDSPRFVMTAEGGFEVGSGADAGKAVASLLLKRLASKVSLTITYKQDLSDPDSPTLITTTNADGTTTVWTPMTEGNVRVYLQNAVSNATLGGFATSQTRFTYADVHPAGEPLKASAFYTYPPKWEEGSDDAPFIKIIQPWSYKTMKDDGTPGSPKPVVVDESTVELYYKVMFPGMTELAGNTDYQFTVQLTVLGGESTRDMKEITPTGFSILPWGNTTGSDLSPIVSNTPKYLAVERKNTVTNNGAGVSIKYTASGHATLTVTKIHKLVYGNHEPMIEREIYPTKDAKVNDVYSDNWFENNYGTDTEKPNEGTITLKHTLSTDFEAGSFAARPYEYALKLHLDSEGANTELDQVFYITQNPALVVKGELSDGYVNVNNHVAFKSDGTYWANSNTIIAYTAPSYYTPSESEDYNRDDNIKIHNIYHTGDYGKTTETYFYKISTSKTGEGGVTLNNNERYRYNANHGYATDEQQSRLGYVWTYADLDKMSGTENKCEYRIIARFSPQAGYFIEDPRIPSNELSSTDNWLYKTINYSTIPGEKTSTERSYSPFSVANATNDIHDAIKKYSPAKRLDSERLIAPEIMVASSYARTNAVFYEGAILRCASYQEDGYPAGRWRLPTEGEIVMLMKLNEKNAIPNLFSGDYFASSGRYYDSDSKKFYNYTPYNATEEQGRNPNAQQKYYGTNYNYDDYRHYVRCVYDTWYWGRDPVTTTSDGTTPIKTGTTIDITNQWSEGTSTITRNLYNWSGFMTEK